MTTPPAEPGGTGGFPEGPGPPAPGGSRDQSQQQEPIVVRDRRKIDPETGELRQPQPQGAEGQPAESGIDPSVATDPAETPDQGEHAADGHASAEATAQLAERTADLQRLQAEYANYRKRVDRERESMAAGAKSQVVTELLPVVDDLERAEAHGDLTGPFKAVADKIYEVLHKSGLEAFGTAGEPFDPALHEAVQQTTSPDVSGPTVETVYRKGYRVGERVIRSAMVVVSDAETEPAETQPAETQPSAAADAPGESPIDASSTAPGEHGAQ